MNKTQLEERVKNLEIELDSVKAELYKPVKSKVFVPKVGQKCWWLSALGTANETTNEGCWPDTRRIEYGNYYETEAEAEKAAAKQFATVRVLNKLRELEGDWIADWDNFEQRKYVAMYCYDASRFEIDWWKKTQYIQKEWHSVIDAWEYVIDNMDADLRLMWGVD